MISWAPLDLAAIARFEAKVDRSGGLNACHEWLNAKDRDGYGQFFFAGKQRKAHRFAVYLATGTPPPDNMVPDHRCENRGCMNVRHLELVTNIENVRRGKSPAMLMAKQQLCKNGHEFDAIRFKKGKPYRKCSTCMRGYQRKHKAKKKAQCFVDGV